MTGRWNDFKHPTFGNIASKRQVAFSRSKICFKTISVQRTLFIANAKSRLPDNLSSFPPYFWPRLRLLYVVPWYVADGYGLDDFQTQYFDAVGRRFGEAIIVLERYRILMAQNIRFLEMRKYRKSIWLLTKAGSERWRKRGRIHPKNIAEYSEHRVMETGPG